MQGAELAAWAATGLAATSVLPQVHRLVRTGDVAGVSLAAAAVGVSTEAGWLAYAGHAQLWSAVPEAVVMVAGNVVLVVVIGRAVGRASRRPALLAALAVGVVLTVLAAAGRWEVMGAALALAAPAQLAPSLWTAYRTAAPVGLAPATWLCGLAEGALWGVYGIAHGDGAMQLFAVVMVGSSAAVLARTRVSDARAHAQ